MENNKVNLTNCDIEPIHIPGQIQSHGFLLAIDNTFTVQFHSQNTGAYLHEVSGNLLGCNINSIEAFFDNEPSGFIKQLISLGRNNDFEQVNPYSLSIKGKPYFLVISSSGGFFLLEFEEATGKVHLNVQNVIGRSLSEMLMDKNLQHLLDNTAQQIKKIIQYDRVMIYRFAEDGHGEVVSEARNEDLVPWLGLHYPASDIPKQARELYKKNLTRLIADVHSTPAQIITPGTNLLPLDLTNSQLRAVSPVHIQYLKNMGVASSFSISLIYYKELWGLIACHNYSPQFIDYRSRESAKLIGQILSSAVEFRQNEEISQTQERYNAVIERLTKYMVKSTSVDDALTRNEVTLMDIADANGAVLIYENNIIKLGTTPDDDQLTELINWFKAEINQPLYYTNNLSAIYPSAVAYKQIASGILFCTISKELGDYILWFKAELIHNVRWAGNPAKPVQQTPDGLLHISPRSSFEAWSETVTGTSKNWGSEEIKAIMRLKVEIMYSVIQKASEIRMLNEKLKLAYEEIDTFGYTVSHDLKNPISVIKSYSQILKRDKTISLKSQEILDRIIAGADNMTVMISEVLEYSKIWKLELNLVAIEIRPLIEELVKDLKIVYNAPNAKITIGDTPTIYGNRGMVSQVFSNLLSNAIKYSLKSGIPVISIQGTVNDTEIVYSIADNGLGIDIAQLPKVFDLFKRMDNVQNIEGSGVGLAIVKRIMEKHQGKIWVNSTLGNGSTFYIAFKKIAVSM